MRLLVVGAGGHAKVVIDAAQSAGIEVVGAVGEPQGRSDLLGVPIGATGSFDADAFIIAVGDNRGRSELFEEYQRAGLVPAAVIHPSAVIAPSASIGAGTFVAAGVIVNPEAVIGRDVILNTGCSVDHDCAVGDHAHIGPLSGLCGGVTIGTGVLVGAGCSVIPSRSVGDWSVVGAGSVVVDDIGPEERCAGVPARPIRSSAGER